MIFLTGDVHDMSMGRDDQEWLKKHSDLTEIECAHKYSELAEKYKLKMSLRFFGHFLQWITSKLAAIHTTPFSPVGDICCLIFSSVPTTALGIIKEEIFKRLFR